MMRADGLQGLSARPRNDHVGGADNRSGCSWLRRINSTIELRRVFRASGYGDAQTVRWLSETCLAMSCWDTLERESITCCARKVTSNTARSLRARRNA